VVVVRAENQDMKRRDIWISLAIIAVSAGALYFYTQGTGYIQVDAGGAEVTLELRSSLFGNATIRSDRAPAAVRAQIHKPRRLSLSMKQDRHTWRIDSQGQWSGLAKIRVKNNRTTVLRLGPPFLIRPRIWKNGPVVSIEFDIVGQAGEQYQKFARKSNRAVARAKVNIVGASGKVLESGQFRYG